MHGRFTIAAAACVLAAMMAPSRTPTGHDADRGAARVGWIRSWVAEADLAFRRGEYETSREYLGWAFAADPGNVVVREFVELTREEEHRIRGTVYREWKHLLADLQTGQCIGDGTSPAATESR